MKQKLISEQLGSMAQMPGIDACALVEVEAGMTWQVAGDLPHKELLAEAATDYWRIYLRNRRDPKPYGEMRAQVMMHQTGRTTIVPCGKGALLVCFSDETIATDWTAWQRELKALQQLVGAA